ncbi:hypothetical protein AVEN_140028-1 [Araneus ventricosus]|uniref:Uncharacterized protein n=1 Tax=Araneus ventricosus TaxID=182803 RepID=A0A4Y2PDR8_ARAVE|nr:hypothetical protein AVEN_140028-1 [Araneus ventricosus]
MTRGKRKLWVAFGDHSPPPDKSRRCNLSATPHGGWMEGFLSWSLEERREIETGIRSSIRIQISRIEIDEYWKSGLGPRFCTCTGA